jgi:hypothetical protein
MGDNVVHYSGHLAMMAAAQPFLSGAISKTVNTPEDTTVEEIEQLFLGLSRDLCPMLTRHSRSFGYRGGREGSDAGQVMPSPSPP